MNKAVMLSIQPQYCELITSGKKTVEVRKTRPSIETPFKCYIYMTATKDRCRFWEYITAYQNSKGDILDGSQKVIGEFMCDKISRYGDYEGKIDSPYFITPEQLKQTCLTYDKFKEYGRNDILYGWHISNLVIYDKPRKIEEFARPCDGCDKIGISRCTEEISPCRATILKRPPQSWQYVQSIW